jgi:ring-1,2-phenylacetyl-CoA epoxidase subunit PaaE
VVEAARKALAARGVDESAIHDELFYAGGEVGSEITLDDEVGSTVRFVLNGRTSTVVIDPQGAPILDHALLARPDAPFSCRSGACASCRAVVTAGEVTMERNWALSDEEVAAGQILTCQSHPVSETVELSYDL